MEFTIFLSHMRIKDPAEYVESLYTEKLVEAKVADQLGFECIWVPEHHLIHFMQAPSGLLLAAHYGAHVRCPIGQMVNLLLYRHPLVTAGEIAQADELLGGRLQLGVGRGAYEYEFRRMGLKWEGAYEKFHECLDILESVWNSPGKGIAYDGDFYQFDTTHVWPKSKDWKRSPIWYASMTPPSVEYAAERGYNVATWPFLRPMSFVEEIASTFHAAREKAGNTKGVQKLAVMRPVFVAGNEKEARKAVPTMLTNHRLSQRIREPGVELDDRGYISPDSLDNEPSLDEAFEVMIAGNPDQCIEKLNRYADSGVDQFICWFDFGMEHAQNLETMQMFAEEVMTPFRRQRNITDDVKPLSASSATA